MADLQVNALLYDGARVEMDGVVMSGCLQASVSMSLIFLPDTAVNAVATMCTPLYSTI